MLSFLKPRRKSTTVYKGHTLALASLDRALEHEKKKNNQCPVLPDMAADHVNAGGWGYVVAGYSLLEQALKYLLHIRGKSPRRGHALLPLFRRLPPNDQIVLSEYYEDLRINRPDLRTYPLKDVKGFLKELDGKEGSASFDWRYFLIERNENGVLPYLSIDFLHEVGYGAIRLIEEAKYKHRALQHTYSFRCFWERQRKYLGWLRERMNKPGWDQLGDRLEFYGKFDHRGRSDFAVFQSASGEKMGSIRFGQIPKNLGLPYVDMQTESQRILRSDLSATPNSPR